MDLINELVEGRAQFEWAPVISSDGDTELTIFVLRDSMKFGGVRRSSTAVVLQQIADLLGAMLLTPKVIDLIWFQAQTRIDSITRDEHGIVADSTDEIVSGLVDAAIVKVDQGGLTDSTGKNWCICNKLADRAAMPVDRIQEHYGIHSCCNYGWPSSLAPTVSDVTHTRPDGKPHHVWQTIGLRHNSDHHDPSQTIRLMFQRALLKKGETASVVHLHDVARDPDLAHLINHDGVLRCLRQPDVPMPVSTLHGDVAVSPVLTVYAPPTPFR